MVMDRGQVGSHADPARQLGLDLRQGDIGLGIHKLAQQSLVRLQDRTAIASDPRGLQAAGLMNASDQLDRCRDADAIAARGLADRAATFNRRYNPSAQVLGQRCSHLKPHVAQPPRRNQTTRICATSKRSRAFSGEPDPPHRKVP
jgi:hypothetical protein